MQGLKQLSRRFARDTRGATAIEYGLIVTLIAVGTLGAMTVMGGGVRDSWSNTGAKVSEAMK